MDILKRIKDLMLSDQDFDKGQAMVVDALRETFRLSRVTIMLYNSSNNMLESVSAAGVPNIDHRNIRAPVVRMEGISSRAVEARVFLENRPIVVRDRSGDPQYRMRHKFPHKIYSREFAVFPLAVHTRKLGVIAVAVDEGNPAGLTPAVVKQISRAAPLIARFVEHKIPKPPSDRALIKAVTEVVSKGLYWTAYQPIVDLRRRQIHGHEALLRIDHPLIDGPYSMIQFAEQFNALRDISFSSHTTALKILPKLPSGVKLFVNFHPKDFIEYENIDDPANPFYRKDLTRLVLEITERSLLKETDHVHSVIRFFKGLGAKIALDDLGSGYSSLELLTILDADYIKIDMSLIRRIHRNDRKQKLLKSILYYCEQIGSLCVAEGVETSEELETLRDMNCPLAQGFFIARPSPKLVKESEIFKSDG